MLARAGMGGGGVGMVVGNLRWRSKRKTKGGWLWDGHAHRQSTGNVRRCERIGWEGDGGMKADEEGESLGAHEVKSGGPLSEAAMPEAGPH